MESATGSSLSSKLWFWSHLALVILAWTGPFIADWYLLACGYGLVLLQFAVFKRCLMNDKHDLIEEDNHNTFYAQLLESVGIRIPRKPLKQFVRTWLYALLGFFAWLLQVKGGYIPPFHIDL